MSSGNLAGLLVIVILLSAGTGFFWFFRFPDSYSDDSASYMDAAQNLIAGKGFTNAAGYPEVIRTPGYPLLIAPFLRAGLGPKGVLVLQHLFRIAIALGTTVVAFRLSRNQRQAFLAGALLTLDLPTLDSANSILTESLFTVLLCLTLLSLCYAARISRFFWWSAVPGALAGLTALVRPVGLFFAVPAAAYLVLARAKSKLRSTLCFILAFACPLLVWGARNHFQTGSSILFPISAWEMLGYRAAGVLAINDPGNFDKNFEHRQEQLVNQVCQEMPPPYGNPCLPLIKPQAAISQKSVYYMRLGVRIVLRHPVSYLKLGVRGTGFIMLGDDANRFAQLTGISHGTAAKLLLLYTIPTLFLSLVGAWSYWRSDRLIFFLLVMTMLYFVVITAGAEGYSRYRVPVVPVYAILIAAGVSFIWKHPWRRLERNGSPWAKSSSQPA